MTQEMLLQPLKCSACGANLGVAPGQVLAACGFCHAGYEVLGTNPVGFSQALAVTDDRPALLLPFWLVRFDVHLRGFSCTSPNKVSPYKETQPGPADQADELYARLDGSRQTMLIAAFRANNFINYTADLSLEITRRWDEPRLVKPDHAMPWPLCHYDHLDARKIASVLLKVKVNKDVGEIVGLEFDAEWKEHRLIWWPFAEDGDFWRDMKYGERILKSALPAA
ncbi:MAG TPA: hypothetical protein VMF29_06870, partial [Candidatus Edwardsbacteria bacterium]|nr:hypothetical protein [Candidatus Edwardsbacteria bacterium]